MGATQGETASPSNTAPPPGTPPKKRTRGKTAAIIVAVIMVLAVIGGVVYYYETQSSSSSSQFTVGVVGPLTGGLGAAGTPWSNGVTVWANAMNALGGVHYNGKLMKVSVKFYDDQSNPSTAVQLVRQAVSSDHVDMLITGFLTPDTDAISSVVQQLQVPIVANAAEDPEFHVGNPYLYSIYPPSTPEMQMFANFFESLTPQPFNVSTVYSNEEAMVSMLSTTIYLLGSNYHVLYNATYDPTALTSSAADTYLLAAEAANPQMIMFTDEYPGNIITMIQQMASLNIRPNLIFSEDMWDSPFFISQLGATANGMVGQDNWAYNMTKADASGDYANASFWYNQTNAEFGASIATNQLPYQAIMACEVQFAAIEKAGATSGSSVIAALASLNMPTVDGRFSPNTYGMDPARDPFIIQIQNGEPVIVAPAQYATATVEYPLSPTWP